METANQLARAGDARFANGQFREALRYFLAASRQQPQAAEHHYRAGLAHWRLGEHEPAKREFEEAIVLKPDDPAAHGELGRVLLAMGNVQRAAQHARRAVELAPNDRELAVTLASVLDADGQGDAAWKIVDRLLRDGHESTDLALVYARLASRRDSNVGRALPAIDVLGGQCPPYMEPPGAIAGSAARTIPPPRENLARSADPTRGAHGHFGPAGQSDTDALGLIAHVLSNPATIVAQQSALHFAAANLLDAAGKYDEAFAHATAANTLRGASYDPPAVEQSIQKWIEYFSRSTLARLPRATHRSEVPVFIVGMPRSGTSLVEQIVASHPAVHGAGELDWIARLCEFAVQRGARGAEPTLECLDRLSTKDADELAAHYLGPLRALNPSATRITDKMPTNFIYLGFIAMLFPQARVIHCRRERLDTCLSCYMTDFTAGHDFSFSLESTGHFYRQYERMMWHWKSALDLPMLDVDYETVVSDLEGHARKMVEFLGLPWDERCLRYHDNRRFVGTASHAQVRRPIYRTSVGRWRNYERHLDPLKRPLGLEVARAVRP